MIQMSTKMGHSVGSAFARTRVRLLLAVLAILLFAATM